METCLRILLLVLIVAGVAHSAEEIPPAVDEIRREATRSSSDPEGRPLPLAAHWNRGTRPTGFGPPYQLDLIRDGHHLLPWFQFPNPTQDVGERGYYTEEYFVKCFRQCAEWKLPITFVGTQWEFLLVKSQFPGGPYPWKDLPEEQNPAAFSPEGKRRPLIDAFGPVEPWKEVGAVWVKGPLWRKMQEWYPDPPLVVFLSNNEAPTLRWAKGKGIEQSSRYLEKYGKGRSGAFKRKVIGDAWIERYRAMLDSMRNTLTNENWRESALFVGYGNFGPSHLARWSGWKVYSLHTDDRVDWAYKAWGGASPSYYTHNWDASTDFRVWSPQVESMNWVFMQDEVLADKPGFWFEISIWDGDSQNKTAKRLFYEKLGQKYNPERYAGFVQYGMWLLTPRVVREFRGYLDTRERVGEYFEAIVASVDRVYADPVLERFWRKGELVPNRLRKHPYNVDLPEQYKDKDRWFLLETSLDPKWPWTQKTEIPVFSLARVIGEPETREWLLYAHAPVKARQGVTITIPEYKPVTVDVSVRGSFYHLREKDGTIEEVGNK